MLITTHLDKVSPQARAAWLRCIKPDNTLRRTPPRARDDPNAWAAWQGYHTAFGLHEERATATLMMIGREAGAIWEEISDLTIACRRAVQAGRVTFTVQ